MIMWFLLIWGCLAFSEVLMIIIITIIIIIIIIIIFIIITMMTYYVTLRNAIIQCLLGYWVFI